MNLRRRGLTGFSLLMCLALAVSTHIHVVDVSETRMALQCFEDSWQLHGAMWTKDGQPLHEVSSASKLVIISDTNVTIDPVMPADEGVYRCNGGRRLGLTGEAVQNDVNMHPIPFIIMTLKFQSVI